MIWVIRVVEIILMAGEAIGRSAGVSISMALEAVHTHVTSGQREGCVIMLEVSWGPGRFCMTRDTVCRELRVNMVGVGGVIEVILMTGEAISRSAGVSISMALEAVHTHVSSGQREGGVIMLEVSRSPR